MDTLNSREKTLCSFTGCSQEALFKSARCAHHLEDIGHYMSMLKEFLLSTKDFSCLNLSNLVFSDLTIEGKYFYFCNLHASIFTNCEFDNINFQLSFFDSCRFFNCRFNEGRIGWSVLADSLFDKCTFSKQDIFRSNFNACRLKHTSFQNSSLFTSRFIKADFFHSEFVDCNLLRVHFEYAQLNDTLFKNSNQEEAIFDSERIEE